MARQDKQANSAEKNGKASKLSESRAAERPSIRPSDRMFRRSRAAENRRRISQNKDARFFKTVSILATVGIFIVFLVIIFMTKVAFGRQAETSMKTGADSELTQPLLGDFSALDLLGLAFVIVAGYAVFRKYSNKD